MILCFEFVYKSSNSLLPALASAVLEGLKCEYSILRQGHILSIFVKGDEDSLKLVANELSSRLAHSIFINSSKVYVCEGENLQKSNCIFASQAISNISPAQISLYLNKGEISPNEFGILSDIKVGDVKVERENFKALLKECLSSLLADKCISLSDSEHSFVLSPRLQENSSYAMPTNLKHIGRMFIADEKSLLGLASFEKPRINLRSTAIYRNADQNAPAYMQLCCARDLFLYALCDELAKSGLSFLFASLKSQSDEPFCVVPYEGGYAIASGTKYLSQDDLKFLSKQDDKNFALFGLSSYELGFDKNDKLLRVFCSTSFDDEIELFANNQTQRLLNFNAPKSFEELFESIAKLEGGDRLLANYQKEFSLPSGKLELKNGFFALFCIAGSLLGLSDEPLSAGRLALELASDFGGAKGVKMDFKMSGQREFDLARAVRSMMSFRLAGVGDKNLCFGIADSLAFFLDDFISYAKSEYGVVAGLASGALFKNKALLDLCFKHAKIRLSGEFALESEL